MERVLTFFKENPVFFLATAEGDQPRVRPFGAVASFEGKLYICTNNTKPVFKQMQANPRVEICGATADGSWLRVTATAVRDERREAKAQMLAENPSLKNMYNLDDGIFEVLYLGDATAVFSSFSAAPETVTF